MNNTVNSFDQQLTAALTDYLRQQLETMPDEREPADQLAFSARFERRISRLILRAARVEAKSRVMTPAERGTAHRVTVRRRLVIAAIIIAILTSVFGITAAREAVINFIVKTYEKYSTIIFPTAATTGSQTPDSGNPAAWPADVPDGYTASVLVDSPVYALVAYKNSNGAEILLERALSAHLQVEIDTEGVPVEYIARGGRMLLCYLNKGVQTVIWQDGAFAYLLSGPVSREILFKMIDSIP